MDFASPLLLDERAIAPVLEEPYFAVKLVTVVAPAMLPPPFHVCFRINLLRVECFLALQSSLPRRDDVLIRKLGRLKTQKV